MYKVSWRRNPSNSHIHPQYFSLYNIQIKFLKLFLSITILKYLYSDLSWWPQGHSVRSCSVSCPHFIRLHTSALVCGGVEATPGLTPSLAHFSQAESAVWFPPQRLHARIWTQTVTSYWPDWLYIHFQYTTKQYFSPVFISLFTPRLRFLTTYNLKEREPNCVVPWFWVGTFTCTPFVSI